MDDEEWIHVGWQWHECCEIYHKVFSIKIENIDVGEFVVCGNCAYDSRTFEDFTIYGTEIPKPNDPYMEEIDYIRSQKG